MSLCIQNLTFADQSELNIRLSTVHTQPYLFTSPKSTIGPIFHSSFQPNFDQTTTEYGWTGLGIQVGLGLLSEWTILFDLDVLFPTVSTASLSSFPNQIQLQSDCTSCTRQEWEWEGTQVPEARSYLQTILLHQCKDMEKIFPKAVATDIAED